MPSVRCTCRGDSDPGGDATWVNRFADYDRFLDALAAAKAQAGVKNTAMAIGLLLDLVERYVVETPKGEEG